MSVFLSNLLVVSWRQVFICLRPPVVVSNFVGSDWRESLALCLLCGGYDPKSKKAKKLVFFFLCLCHGRNSPSPPPSPPSLGEGAGEPIRTTGGKAWHSVYSVGGGGMTQNQTKQKIFLFFSLFLP
jgi:hypothetical protein